MFFTILEGRVPADAPPETAYLIIDNWDDNFAYSTMFTLVVIDPAGERHHIGSVKIGERGMPGGHYRDGVLIGQRRPNLPDTFDAVGEAFFSLGADETYYEALNDIGDPLKERVLLGLRDIANNLALFDEVADEDVVRRSLLRDKQASRVRSRYHRLARGDARLTQFHFRYTLPGGGGDDEPPVLEFDVTPNSQPPTNVHVLIGRNGVGKTRLMQGLARSLIGHAGLDDWVGQLELLVRDDLDDTNFASLVLVSFSAFDEFELGTDEDAPIPAIQVGLRAIVETPDGDVVTTKNPRQLANDFVASLEKCRVGLRASRWRKAIETLETDDLFAEANIGRLLDLGEDEWKPQAIRLFTLLSSGHKIILLTITKLVEHTEEKTLVLLDEPEAHLHPPLLAAFIRSLSDLLVSRNAVAIIATHSPVVLQEVPRSCAWKIRRSGRVTNVDRPEGETFAENVSDLTREVFGLEITRSGFHQMIAKIVKDEDRDYEEVVGTFRGQLGAEGKALARALVIERDAEAE